MIDIAGAKKKLRQAEFFLGHLEHASRKMVLEPPNPTQPGNREHLEFYFSATLSAAQSVYYVLDETGGKAFKESERRWRTGVPEPQRSRFGRMIGLRDKDVHFATSGVEALPKYVSADFEHHGPQYGLQDFYNAAIFGPRPVIEERNPDGTTVRGSVLRGTVGLYIERDGRRVEATTACREFIEQLRSLVEAMRLHQTNP